MPLFDTVHHLQRWPSRRRHYRHMLFIRQALLEAFPETGLLPGGSFGDRLPLADSHKVIYRSIIEIHDGLRRLRGYADVRDLKVTWHCDEPPTAAAEAAILMAAYVTNALWRCHHGVTLTSDEPAPAPSHLLDQLGSDLDDNATWMANVSLAFRYCVTPLDDCSVTVDDVDVFVRMMTAF